MKKYSAFFAGMLILLLALACSVQANYWFQSGVVVANGADYNNGASVQIETIAPQNLTTGSMAFWVGESLSNGAFIQTGYSISNQSGNLTTGCTLGGCSGTEPVTAGDAEWFYEYFSPGNNVTFYGTTGPDGSAGANGTFNTYAFYSVGNVWHFLFNNNSVGIVDLGASGSGSYEPIAIGEVANTTNARNYMKQVIFANLSIYRFNVWSPVQSAYESISYGVGSDTSLKNPYGVEEIGNRTNYFAVGSGLPASNKNINLWNRGYKLSVNSRYGNISSGNTYLAYSTQTISAPPVVNVSNNTRTVFTGWTGSGVNFYTGSKNSVQLLLASNVTENANWLVQYLVSVSSPYGKTGGSGWYDNGSTANYSISNASFSRDGKEFRFVGWSNGNANANSSVQVSGPLSISALWQYGVKIVPVDAYGRALNVSYLLIDNKQFNTTPFLYTNRVSNLSGLYYHGMLIPVSLSINESSPQTESIQLPVDNLSIKTTGLLSLLSVNATAIITYKNGTTATEYTGSSGVLNIPGVPYGYANVTLKYFGSEQNFLVRSGTKISTSFFSAADIIWIVIAASVCIYLIDRRLKRRHETATVG